jgi:RNA polymerase-binding transcription factor DksA
MIEGESMDCFHSEMIAMAMTQADRDRYQQQLVELGRRLKGEVQSLENQGLRTSGGEPSGNLSNAPVHMGDLSADTFAQEVTLGLLENKGQVLEEVAAAMERLRAGTFGQCQECGREIARLRLNAVPYTRYCMDCARRLEQSGDLEPPNP